MCRDICRRNTEQDPRDGDVHDRGFAGGVRNSRGASRDRHDSAFDRRSADGKAQCDNPKPAGGGNARLRVRYLFRQDRNSDAEQNDPCFSSCLRRGGRKDHIIVQRERKAASYVRNSLFRGQRDRGKRRG